MVYSTWYMGPWEKENLEVGMDVASSSVQALPASPESMQGRAEAEPVLRTL